MQDKKTALHVHVISIYNYARCIHVSCLPVFYQISQKCTLENGAPLKLLQNSFGSRGASSTTSAGGDIIVVNKKCETSSLQ